MRWDEGTGPQSMRITSAPSAAGAGRFVAEVKLVGDYPDVRALCGRARAAAEALNAEGRRVRFVRAVFVPEDGICLLVFEAPDAVVVRAVAEAAALDVNQISEALTIDGS